MSFFEGLPSPPEPPDDEAPERPRPEWYGPPAAVMGGVVPVAEAVARTSHVFVGLAAVTAYRSGMSMSVVVAARRGELARDDWEALAAPFSASRLYSQRGSAGSGAFRIGVELADGRRTAAVEHFRQVGDSQPDPPVLRQHGGGGSGRPGWMESRLELWLWPLPDGDAVSLVLQWPDLGVPLTSHRIDLEPVRVAGRALPYWP